MKRRTMGMLVAFVVLLALHPAAAEIPTPSECAAGGQPPVTVGQGIDDKRAVCVAAGGHTALYVGGSLIGPCGAIVAADQAVVANDDPNECAGATDGLSGSTWREDYVASYDGTELHADIYRPMGLAEDVRTPVLLIVTPYSNTGGTGDPGIPPDINPAGTNWSANSRTVSPALIPVIFEHGYTVVVVAFRAMGASAGCDDFGGETARLDVKAAVEWAASQPWSTGRVGMWGLSAEGWSQVMALATKPVGLAAVVIQAPPINRYAQSYMNGVQYALHASASAFRYTYIDAVPPSLLSSTHQFENWADGGVDSLGGCNERNLVESANDDPASPYWAQRDLTMLAEGSDVPVLFSQGFMDSNVKPGSFLPLWSSLTGPHRAWLGQYEHVGAESPSHPFDPPGSVGRNGFLDEALRWLDAYVKQVPTDLSGDPPVIVERSDGRWRSEMQWPPADATVASYPLNAGSYLDIHGNSAEAADPAGCNPGSIGGASSCMRLANGIGAWTFTSPLAQPIHIAGVPVLDIQVDTTVPKTNLIALLYDVDAGRNATLLDRGAFLIRDPGPQTIHFELYPQDWFVPAGHRLGVLLTGSDDGWFNPISTLSRVSVLGGSFALPLLPEPRAGMLDGTLSLAGQTRAPFKVKQGTVDANTVDE